jgi:DNA repair protein RecO (recombination protein O)
LQIKNNSEKLRTALYICELLDRLIREEKDERIWLLMMKILKKIESPEFSGKRLELLLCYFEWNLLDILGYHPELYKCINCRNKLKEGILYFSAKEGGVLCSYCRNKDKGAINMEVDSLKLLRLILGRKKEILEKLKIEKNDVRLKNVTQYYMENILGEGINLI